MLSKQKGCPRQGGDEEFMEPRWAAGKTGQKVRSETFQRCEHMLRALSFSLIPALPCKGTGLLEVFTWGIFAPLKARSPCLGEEDLS